MQNPPPAGDEDEWLRLVKEAGRDPSSCPERLGDVLVKMLDNTSVSTSVMSHLSSSDKIAFNDCIGHQFYAELKHIFSDSPDDNCALPTHSLLNPPRGFAYPQHKLSFRMSSSISLDSVSTSILPSSSVDEQQSNQSLTLPDFVSSQLESQNSIDFEDSKESSTIPQPTFSQYTGTSAPFSGKYICDSSQKNEEKSFHESLASFKAALAGKSSIKSAKSSRRSSESKVKPNIKDLFDNPWGKNSYWLDKRDLMYFTSSDSLFVHHSDDSLVNSMNFDLADQRNRTNSVGAGTRDTKQVLNKVNSCPVFSSDLSQGQSSVLNLEEIQQHAMSNPSAMTESQKETVLLENLKQYFMKGHGARILVFADQENSLGYVFRCFNFLKDIFLLLIEEYLKTGHQSPPTQQQTSSYKYKSSITAVPIEEIFQPIIGNETPQLDFTARRNSFTADNPQRRRQFKKRKLQRPQGKSQDPQVSGDSDIELDRNQPKLYFRTPLFPMSSIVLQLNTATTALPLSPPVSPSSEKPSSLSLEEAIMALLSLIAKVELLPCAKWNEINLKATLDHMHFSVSLLLQLVDQLDPPPVPDFIRDLLSCLVKLFFCCYLKIMTYRQSVDMFSLDENLFVKLNKFSLELFKIVNDRGTDFANSGWAFGILCDVAFGMMYSIKSVALLSLVKPTSNFKNDVGIVHKILNSGFGELLRDFYCLIPVECSQRRFEFLHLISDVILSIKSWKVNVFHFEKCSRTNHLMCKNNKDSNLSVDSIHHLDLFGTTGADSSSFELGECFVSVLVKILLDCYSKCKDDSDSLCCVNLFRKIGFCCCMGVSTILSFLLNFIENKSVTIVNIVFTLIENAVWTQFGGGVQNIQASVCSICHTRSLNPSSDTESGRWSSLNLYSNLFFNPSISQLVAKHILYLATISKPQVVSEIWSKSLLTPMDTIVKQNFLFFPEDHSSSLEVLNNVMKCLKIVQSTRLESGLLPFLVSEAKVLIDFCSRHPTTRREAFRLFCSLVIVEQSSKLDVKKAYVECSPNFVFSERLLAVTQDWSLRAAELFKMLNNLPPVISKCSSPPPKTEQTDDTFCITENVNKIPKTGITGSQQRKFTPKWLRNVRGEFEAISDFWCSLSSEIQKNEQLQTFMINFNICLQTIPILSSIVKCATHLDIARIEDLMNFSPKVFFNLVHSLLAISISCLNSGEEIEMLEDLKKNFWHFKTLHCRNLRKMVTVLLHYEESLVSKDDLDESSRQFSDFKSEDDSCIFESDDGYEADAEDSSLGKTYQSEGFKAFSTYCFRSLADFIIVAVKITVKHHRQFTKAQRNYELSQEQDSCYSDEAIHLSLVTQCLHSVIGMCKKSEDVCRFLQLEGLLAVIIQGFEEVLSNNHEKHNYLISTICSLWTEVAKYQISPDELSQFFKIFKSSSPPCSMLVQALQMIFKKAAEPEHTLTFPCQAISQQIQKISECFVPMKSLSSFVEVKLPTPPVVEIISLLRDSHIKNGIHSCISTCALACPIPRSLDWSSYQDGFSLAIWFKIQRNVCSESQENGFSNNRDGGRSNSSALSCSRSRNKFHVLSVGTQHLLFSLWVDTSKGFMCATASKESNSSSSWLGEHSIPASLEDGWHHLALSISGFNLRKGGSTKMTVILDASFSVDLSFTIPAIVSVKKSTPTYILLGQTDFSSLKVECRLIGTSTDDPNFFGPFSPSGSSSYYTLLTGTIFVFKKNVLTKENALSLLAIGKDAQNLLVASAELHKILLPPHITPAMLASGIDQWVLFKDIRTNLSHLQRNLLMMYSPKYAKEFLFYNLAIQTFPDLISDHYPKCERLKCILFAAIEDEQIVAPPTALLQLGGAPHIAFLIARIAELRLGEKELADSISLFLAACRSSPTLTVEFASIGGANLLCRLLLSPLVPSGVAVLKSLLDSCTHGTSIHYEVSKGSYLLSCNSPLLLVDRHLLEQLMLNWRSFLPSDQDKKFRCFNEKDLEVEGIGIILSVIKQLLLHSSPYRSFNLRQLRDIKAIKRTFQMLEEAQLEGISLESHCPVDLVVEVVGMLLNKMSTSPDDKQTSPPSEETEDHGGPREEILDNPSSMCPPPAVDSTSTHFRVEDFVELGRFLLLLHPDVLTYVSTDPFHAYYLTQMQITIPVPKKKGSSVSTISLADGSKELTTKFSNWSLHNYGSQSPYLEEPLIEEAEDCLSNTNLFPGMEPMRTIFDHLPDILAGAISPTNESAPTAINFQQKLSAKNSCREPNTRTQDTQEPDSTTTKDALKPEPATKSSQDTNPTINNRLELDLKTKDSKEQDPVTKDSQEQESGTDISHDSDAHASSSESDDGFTQLLIAGLLELMVEVLTQMTDTIASVITNEVFNFDLLIVLANNSSPTVKTSVIKLLTSIVQNWLGTNRGFIISSTSMLLFSHQMHKGVLVSEDLVNAAFAFALHKKSFDMSTSESCRDLGLSHENMIGCFIPLLSILPKTIHDLSLCRKSLRVLYHILKNNQLCLLDLLNATYLLDSLLALLRAFLHTSDTTSDACVGNSDYLTIRCYFDSIFILFARELTILPFKESFVAILDIDYQLNLLVRNEAARCRMSSRCVGLVLDIEAIFLRYSLAPIGEYTLPRLRHTKYSDSEETEYTSYSSEESAKESSMENSSVSSSSTLKEQNLPNRNLNKISVENHRSVLKQGLSLPSITKIFSRDKEDPQISELVDRCKILLQRAVDCAIFIGKRNMKISPHELSLIMNLFEILFHGVVLLASPPRMRIHSEIGYRVISACREAVFMHFSLMLMFVSAPSFSRRVRIEAVNLLAQKRWLKEVLVFTSKKNMLLAYRFGIFVYDLLYEKPPENDRPHSAKYVLKVLAECGVYVLPPPQEPVPQWSVVKEERQFWEEELSKMASLVFEKLSRKDQRVLNKNYALFQRVCMQGNQITSRIVQAQDKRRKDALRRVKEAQFRSIKYSRSWKDIVDTVSHERATWHFHDRAPKSWKLDDTEGPLRMRKRLTRARLNIKESFFLREFVGIIKEDKGSGPLEEILVDGPLESAVAHMVESINEDEEILYMSHATVVSLNIEQEGEFLVGHKNIYFIGEEPTNHKHNSIAGVVSRHWATESVREITKRWYQLKDCALELFSIMGNSALFAFRDTTQRNEVMHILTTVYFPNLLSQVSLSEYTTQWKEGHMTNFEYLTLLNKSSGRSFNDLMQYPVFPFVLADYESETLDLAEPKIYRNLKKPVPIQKEEREELFRSNYEASQHMSPDGPYHYGSHYSNSVIVLYYLVRLPPFTELFLDFQDGNFDVPDRSFHTLGTTWRLAAYDSMTAIRELIPEFYFLPEMFLNSRGFDFGLRQNGTRVDHAILPPWCQNNPRRFVLVHRAMLESAYVTSQLHHWIDLVFGFKQTGQAAIEAINVFHPSTYFGYDVDCEDDELILQARRTMIRTYGQTPRQLFTSYHPAASGSHMPQFKSSIGSKKVIKQVFEQVKGIPWGVYAGSPADPKLSVQIVQSLRSEVGEIYCLTPTEILLLPPFTSAYIIKDNKEFPTVNLIYWNNNDGVIRYRRFKDTNTRALISLPSHNKVTCCRISQKQLWLGMDSGQVLVYLVSRLQGKGDLAANIPNLPLLGHSAAVSSLWISASFKVCLSGGCDGGVVLWDTNRLTFINCVTVSDGLTISHVVMSETLGDWVAVTSTEGISMLNFYSLNGQLIGSTSLPSLVKDVTISSAPEGRNVNVIAACLSDGTIRLYSTWDLSPIRRISTDKSSESFYCLSFSQDNYHLCAVTESQLLLVWSTSQVKTKIPRFLHADLT